MADPIQEFDQQQIRDGKVFAILSYLSILCILPLLFKKDNTFVLAHSKQGLVLFVAQAAIFIISIVFPWLFRPIFFVLGVLSLWGIVEVIRGRFVRLPVVADIADSITL